MYNYYTSLSIITLQKNPPKEKEIKRMERQTEILKFIKINTTRMRKYVSENKIVLHIDKLGLGVRDTVRGELTRMQKNEMIKIETGRPGQGHRISINEESELIWIQNKLTEIDVFMKSIYQLINTKPNLYISLLELGFSEPINFMLQVLLERVNKIIIPCQNDSNKLYTKILDLMLKVTQLYSNVYNPKDYLKILIDDVNFKKEWHYVQSNKAKLNVMNNLASILQDFGKQFP